MTEDKQSNRKPVLFMLAAVLIIIAGTAVFFLMPTLYPAVPPAQGNQNCRVDRDGRLMDPCVPLLKIVNGTNNTIGYRDYSAWRGEPAPSPDECKLFAVKALEPYGGMPRDAVVTSVEDSSWYSEGSSTVTIKSGVGSRKVYYRQSPYGMPVFGNAGEMSVEFGFGGNVSEIDKHWLTLEETGLARVVPASKGIRRLERGDARNMPDDVLNLTIHDMRLGYFTPVNDSNPPYLEPVWVFNTTDEIRSRALTLIVSAEMIPEQHDVYDRSGSGTIRNFSEREGKVLQPDVQTESNVLIGTSGPVGKEKALDAIRKFTGNPDINLTYNGRFIEHNECGWVYYWNYYDFTYPGCEFKVETYTGSVLSAVMTQSCTNVRIRNLLEIGNTTPEVAGTLVSNVTRDRYSRYDKDHMTVILRELYNSGIVYRFDGDSSSIFITFNQDDGLLTRYEVINSKEMTMCSRKPVRIGD